MDELKHYGTPQKSGRYPWGSGENPYQNDINFLSYVNDLRKKGMSDAKIAETAGMNSKELRARITISTAETRAADRRTALKYKDKGYSNVATGQKMGINESSVR